MDGHVSLALALHAQPGKFAALVGAGLSMAAGLPSAWDVQQTLIRRVAAAEGIVTLDDPDDWWSRRHGDGGYSDLLSTVQPTQAGRAAILREFFEPTENDRTMGGKKPTDGHHALARLVATGRVPVVLTTNFDTLIETALRDAGIEPVVVVRPTALSGIEPLNHQRALVVHVHGDYLSPDTLNTADELSAYAPELNGFLDEVFDRYGLIIAGWSATWDLALRTRIEAARTSRYGTWWITRHELTGPGAQLATNRDATVVIDDASALIMRVADAVDALDLHRGSDPVSSHVAVAMAKRALDGPGLGIGLHDALRREVASVAALDAVSATDFEPADPGPVLQQRRDEILGGTAVLIALVATTTYWGDARTDAWWVPSIQTLGQPSRGGGLTNLLEMKQSPSMLVTHAAGVSACGSNRVDVIAHLLRDELIPITYRNQFAPAGVALDAGMLWPDDSRPEQRLRDHLHPVLAEAVGLGSTVFDLAWERWALLRYLRGAGLSAENIFVNGWNLPLVRVEGYWRNPVCPAAQRIRQEIAGQGQHHPLLAAGLFCGTVEGIVHLLDQFDGVVADISNRRGFGETNNFTLGNT